MSSDPQAQADAACSVVSRALTDMLGAAGFPGGILLALTPEGKLLFISALPDHAPTNAVELLRTALHYLETNGTPPMNG